MTYYRLPDDGTMSEEERALQAIQETRDGPRGLDHPDGPCSWALHGCRVCEGLERAYQSALKIVFPAPGEGT